MRYINKWARGDESLFGFFLSPEIYVKPILLLQQKWKDSGLVTYYEEDDNGVLWKPQYRLMAKLSWIAVLISAVNKNNKKKIKKPLQKYFLLLNCIQHNEKNPEPFRAKRPIALGKKNKSSAAAASGHSSLQQAWTCSVVWATFSKPEWWLSQILIINLKWPFPTTLCRVLERDRNHDLRKHGNTDFHLTREVKYISCSTEGRSSHSSLLHKTFPQLKKL